MQLQFEKRALSCLTQVLRGTKEQELTQEIRLTESLPDVGRVLAGWGQVILRGKEWQGSHIAVSGGVQAAVLYAPEDGTAPRMVDAWIPFQMKWDGAEAEREGPMRVCPMIRFVDGRNLSARKILVRVGIACLAEGLTTRQAEIYSPGEMPEDVELLRRSYPVRLPREAGEKTFSLEETLDAGSLGIQEILSFTLRPELTETRVSGDKVILRGMGKLHLVYRCREGRIRTRQYDVPFSQLGELERAFEADAQADVLMAVTGLELEMEEENLALKYGLVAQYLVSDRTMLELVEDAYSPRRDVAIHQEELQLPLILDETRERVSARGTFPDMNLDGMDAMFWQSPPRLHREGDRVEVELGGRFQLLGCDSGGSLCAATANWEGKTGLAADPATRIDTVVEPLGEVQWIGTGAGMECRTEAEVRTTAVSRRGMPMITGLELGTMREPAPNRPTLILCRPGSRRLWELAKANGSSVGAIRSANNLQDDPEDNRMLLIPVS